MRLNLYSNKNLIYSRYMSDTNTNSSSFLIIYIMASNLKSRLTISHFTSNPQLIYLFQQYYRHTKFHKFFH